MSVTEKILLLAAIIGFSVGVINLVIEFANSLMGTIYAASGMLDDQFKDDPEFQEMMEEPPLIEVKNYWYLAGSIGYLLYSAFKVTTQ